MLSATAQDWLKIVAN